jgi:hypothetical protein
MTRIDYYRINTSHYDGNLAAVKGVGRGAERRPTGFVIYNIPQHTHFFKVNISTVHLASDFVRPN